MCPSFMVTLDERDSTRGRANALRLAMSGQLENGLANKDLPDILDLCISCKACKAECPSSVDMARLKAEVMQHQFKKYGPSFKDRMVGRSPELARKFSGTGAGFINKAQSFPGLRHLIMRSMGLDTRRKLPGYALKKWTQLMPEKNVKDVNGTPDIVLLADTYTQCQETSSGVAAVRLLESLGKNVLVLDAGCCQRPRISHGFLHEAAALVQHAVELVLPWLKKNIPVAVLEPGCASAWIDDIPDLIGNDETAKALKKIQTFEQVLLDVVLQDQNSIKKIQPASPKILVHGHCHQKSIFGMSAVRSLFALWPHVKFEEIDSGCCGMAGSFGYEANHYDVSRKMAERILVPAIHSKPDYLVVANGFSCRHQIADFAGRKAVHIAEAFTITSP